MKQGSISFAGNNSGGRPIAGANNGLTVSATSFVVLGQDVGAVGDPAGLLSPREIPLNARIIFFRTNSAVQNNTLNIGQFPTNASFAGFGCKANTDNGKAGIFWIEEQGAASVLNPLWFLTVQNGELQINDSTGLFFRMTRLAIAGTFASISAKMSQYYPVADFAINTVIVPTSQRPRAVITNRGAAGIITFTLPAFNAALTFFDYTFTVVAAFAVTILAPAGVTIRIGAVVSPAGGTVTGAAVGSSVRLIQLNATEWQAVAVVGAWVTP